MPSFHSFESSNERCAYDSKSDDYSTKDDYDLSIFPEYKRFDNYSYEELDNLWSLTCLDSVDCFEFYGLEEGSEISEGERDIQLDKQLLNINDENLFNDFFEENYYLYEENSSGLFTCETDTERVEESNITQKPVERKIKVETKKIVKRKRAIDDEDEDDEEEIQMKRIKKLQEDEIDKDKETVYEMKSKMKSKMRMRRKDFEIKSEDHKLKRRIKLKGTKRNRKIYARYHNKKLKEEGFPYPRDNFILWQSEEIDEKLKNHRSIYYNDIPVYKNNLFINGNNKPLKSCLKKGGEKSTTTDCKVDKYVHFYEVSNSRSFWKEEPPQYLNEENISPIYIREQYRKKALKYMKKII